MKNLKRILPLVILAGIGIFMLSADHIDAPAVTGTVSDIGDFYAFQSEENSDNLVFIATTQGLTSPMSTPAAEFDEGLMIEFNIDNTGDNVEDLVIQLIPRDGKMYAFGPYQPSSTGTSSMINESEMSLSVDITEYGDAANIASANGFKLFAGPRDDPFFFDLGQYTQIIGGNATSFNDPGTDALAGTNVMAVVIEVPKSRLEGGAASLNTWVESKNRQ